MKDSLFVARTVRGAGRGKTIGTPTINMHLEDVPSALEHGIYACWARYENKWQQGALHYGPRPVFHDATACEIYLLDDVLSSLPPQIHVCIVSRLRDIRDFPSVDALKQQIDQDVEQTRAILAKHGPPHA